MIHDEICTYEVAKLAKENGFNWICPHYFRTKNKDLFRVFPCEDWSDIEDRINAPTQSLLQRWLREEKKIYIAISIDIDHDLHRVCFEYEVCYDFDGRTMEYHNSYDSFGQYELALEDALKYVLENLV